MTETLRAGLSSIWLVPDSMVQRGVAQELLSEVTARVDGAVVPPPETRKVPRDPATPVKPNRAGGRKRHPGWARRDRYDLSGLPPVPTRDQTSGVVERPTTNVAERMLSLVERASGIETTPLARLAASPWSRGKVIVLAAWDELDAADVGAVVIQLSAVTKDLSPPERPRLLVAARERDIPESALRQVDPLTARVRWWWGGTGRLDTALVVDGTRRLRRQAGVVACLVFRAVIVEVAGPDLALAEHLAVRWDGCMASLPGRVAEFVATIDTSTVSVPRDCPLGSRDRPPSKLRQAWASGLADLWDGEVRISRAVNQTPRPGPDLDTLIWRGQNLALTPVVDRCRVYLQEKVRRKADKSRLAEMVSNDHWAGSAESVDVAADGALELNRMVKGLENNWFRLESSDKALLHHVCDVRNALAHLSPLTDDNLRRLASLMPDGLW